jgi:hypothetical protein
MRWQDALAARVPRRLGRGLARRPPYAGRAGHLRQLHFGAGDGPGLVSDVSGGHNDALQVSREVYTREIGAFLQSSSEAE